MPSLQNIEVFKRSLRALGREPEIAAERGEALVDVRPPEGISQDDLSDLLDFSPLPDEPDSMPAVDGTPESSPAPESDSPGFPGIDEFSSPQDSGELPPELADLFDGPVPSGLSGTEFEDDFSVPEGFLSEADSGEETTAEEDPFSFPEDVSFGETEAPNSETGTSDPFDTEDIPGSLDLQPEDDVSVPDEPPSPDELFSSDFTSSFGEDFTGDLFDREVKPEPAGEESAPGSEFDISMLDDSPDASFDEDPDAFSLPDSADFSSGTGAGKGSGTAPSDEPASIDSFGGDEFSIDEFNLGDIEHEYGLGDDIPGPAAPLQTDSLNPAHSLDGLLQSATPEDEDREAKIQLSEADFHGLQETLTGLPRNLKIIVEDLIGEGQIHGEPLRELIAMLVHGESARTIAGFAGKLTGKKILIPKGYQKKSVQELEAEQGTFTWMFNHTILPMLRILLAVSAALGILVFLGYRFVYRPITAQVFYTRGYGQLEAGKFQPANEAFDKAVGFQPMKGWFFRYAEGFVEKKQYIAAEEKYDQLLHYYPGDERGVLAYAELETERLANYEKAEKILGIILDRELYHYRALLAAGDNYLAWADEDPGKYEEARRSYAMLIEENGTRDELLFRMLRYFIRTDKADEVRKLKTYFETEVKKKIDPEAYAELGGYLITLGELDDVKDILFRAKAQNELIPEIHYNLARLFRKTRQPEEEEKALLFSRELFETSGALSRRRLGMLIDTHIRLGETLYARTEYLSAEQSYRKAIGMYEDALARRLFQPTGEFGRMYAGLADIFYYVSGELSRAGELYLKAREHGFSNPKLAYKVGFVQYAAGKFEAALGEFQKASSGYFNNRNLLYATATALFNREDYFAAQGYYEQLLSMLEREKEGIPRVMLEKDPSQRALVVFLTKVYNNLGVTLYKLGQRTGKVDKTSRAMVHFTYSSEYFDVLSRNPDTLVRSATKNLAWLNTRAVIYPRVDFEPQIYLEIPKDHAAGEF